MFACLKKTMIKQTTEEDPDEGIKDLVELALKKMVCSFSFNVIYVAKDFKKILLCLVHLITASLVVTLYYYRLYYCYYYGYHCLYHRHYHNYCQFLFNQSFWSYSRLDIVHKRKTFMITKFTETRVLMPIWCSDCTSYVVKN